MLPLYARNRLVDIGQYRTLQQVFRAALPDKQAEYVLVEGLRYRLPLLFRVGDPLERREELSARVDYLYFHAEFPEYGGDLLRLAFPHYAVIYKICPEPAPERLMPEHRHRRRIDAS